MLAHGPQPAGAAHRRPVRDVGRPLEQAGPATEGARRDGHGDPDRMQLVPGLRLLRGALQRRGHRQDRRRHRAGGTRRVHRPGTPGAGVRRGDDRDTAGGDRRDDRGTARRPRRRRAGGADHDGRRGESAVPVQRRPWAWRRRASPSPAGCRRPMSRDHRGRHPPDGPLQYSGCRNSPTTGICCSPSPTRSPGRSPTPRTSCRRATCDGPRSATTPAPQIREPPRLPGPDRDPAGAEPVRSRRRLREDYVGPWLPEPLITAPDVADDVVLAESVSMAMMLVVQKPLARRAGGVRAARGVRIRPRRDRRGHRQNAGRRAADRAPGPVARAGAPPAVPADEARRRAGGRTVPGGGGDR